MYQNDTEPGKPFQESTRGHKYDNLRNVCVPKRNTFEKYIKFKLITKNGSQKGFKDFFMNLAQELPLN